MKKLWHLDEEKNGLYVIQEQVKHDDTIVVTRNLFSLRTNSIQEVMIHFRIKPNCEILKWGICRYKE